MKHTCINCGTVHWMGSAYCSERCQRLFAKESQEAQRSYRYAWLRFNAERFGLSAKSATRLLASPPESWHNAAKCRRCKRRARTRNRVTVCTNSKCLYVHVKEQAE